ncbi:MAG: gamma-glutamyltransferase [Acetobacteraceae bacterium]|nr:gamma-glutamyltransferase [Acetobacteraceae bacterium]
MGWRRLVAGLVAASLGACSTLSSIGSDFLGGAPAEGTPGHVSGFLGGVVADEPRAALVAREVLSEGGNAADAAVALGFALAVTLPSRAGLGGGGACIAYQPSTKSANGGVPEAVLFTPQAPAQSQQGADRPAAIPVMARGLFALHARYGRRPFETLISPAEQMARFGVPASRALVRDLQIVSGPLFADPNARAVFSRGDGPLAENDRLLQPELGATLAQIRVSGVGDFYQGNLARRVTDAAPAVGASLTVADLRSALPRLAPPITIASGRDRVSFLPPPADGGLAAAAALSVLNDNPEAVAEANARAVAVAARWRAGDGDPQALLGESLPPASLPPLPASTTFVTLDREGGAVACAVTMDNLFGTGRLLPGLGFLLAASPAAAPPPLLAAAIAWNEHLHAFRAAVGGAGQEGAASAAAVAMINALRSNQPMPVPVPEPGRANVIACSRYLPDSEGSCAWATDPRGFGLAIGSS